MYIDNVVCIKHDVILGTAARPSRPRSQISLDFLMLPQNYVMVWDVAA